MVALVVTLFYFTYRMNPDPRETQEMTLLELYSAMDQGKLVDPVTRVFDRDSGETFLTGDVELNELEKDGSPKKRPYRVALVPGENEALMADLLDKKVKVVVKERKSALSPFVVQTLFFVGMLALMYWFVYRKMGGAGPFGFGKSKAKVLNGKEDTRKKVSFADVAGVDEAREEVQEIVEFLKDPSAFKRLGGRIPKGVLLVGPPGTGKTLLARAIAG